MPLKRVVSGFLDLRLESRSVFVVCAYSVLSFRTARFERQTITNVYKLVDLEGL